MLNARTHSEPTKRTSKNWENLREEIEVNIREAAAIAAEFSSNVLDEQEEGGAYNAVFLAVLNSARLAAEDTAAKLAGHRCWAALVEANEHARLLKSELSRTL